jgi:hypothetical protein
VARAPHDGPGKDGHDEIVEFGSGRSAGRRPLPRWVSRVLLACLVLAAVVTVAVRGTSHHAPRGAAVPPPPPVRVTTVGHRLLGVTAGWELFARGPNELLRIELARGRITQTYVPALETASPDVAFVVGAHEAVIRPSDLVPGYVVPDGGQARPLTGMLSDGGPLVPGPVGSQAAWVSSGSPTSPELSLIALTGHRSGPSIRFQSGGPQVPATAISDGRGDVLVTDNNSFIVYDTGPGWDRPVPGTVIAIGPTEWLVDACDPLFLHCREEVVDTSNGSQRTLPGAAPAGPYYFGWPPTGVISPGGSTAAIVESGRNERLTVHLVDLRTGATRDLNVPVGLPDGDLEVGGNANENSMVWSPDGRWLFVAATGGKLVVVDTRTGRIEGLGIRLPAVDQVAIRP